MIININLNGATSLVASLPVEHMAYVDSVVKFFENNVVAVKDDYYSVSVVDLESVITLGDSVKFQKDNYSNDEKTADLIVTGRSGDVIKDFEPLTPEVLVSNKRQLAKVIKELESVNNENKMLKLQVAKLENHLEELTQSEEL